MKSWVGGAVVAAVLAGTGAAAQAKVSDADKNQSPLHTTCFLIQSRASSLQFAVIDSPWAGWGSTLQAMIELALLGEAWDAMCASTFGSISREGPTLGVPTLHDGDGDLLFDEDELVYGLNPASADSDRDGLTDDVDPSWLADLLDAVGEARLAPLAAEAELAVEAGDDVTAAALLASVRDALGGCEPDPVTFEPSGSEACLAARTLEVHLGLR